MRIVPRADGHDIESFPFEHLRVVCIAARDAEVIGAAIEFGLILIGERY